jgi:hypothetical protein
VAGDSAAGTIGVETPPRGIAIILAMLPSVDIRYIAQELARLGEEIQRAADESGDAIDPGPEVLNAGLRNLLDALADAEADTMAASAHALRERTGSEPDALLSHGIDLLSQLSALAMRLRQPQTAGGVERLTLPVACWLMRRGAELLFPEPVVNAAAALANGLHEPDDLAGLYVLMSEVVDGVSPLRMQEVDDADPSRPWRVLLLNRAIVATRSHRPALMVEAFQAVCEHLPDEAPAFFREGMGQMAALDYPQPVREVMERFFYRWCAGQRLH